jgi:ribosomal protein S21
MVINVEVTARHGEDSDRLIKRFLKKCKKIKLLDELKSFQYFISPSEERHAADKHKLFVIEKKKGEEAGKK